MWSMGSQDDHDAQPGVGGPTAALPDEQIAVNEATAREINDAIEAGRLASGGTSAFICECGQLGCNAMVELTVADYEAVRAHPRRFIVNPGHDAHFDQVVQDAGRYIVVLKHGAPAEIADRTDPRTPEQPSQT
jgi:hypothetical protein